MATDFYTTIASFYTFSVIKFNSYLVYSYNYNDYYIILDYYSDLFNTSVKF